MYSENNDAPSCTSKGIEIVKRCNQCNKIPLIELIERNNEYYIKYNCENGHKDEINLEKYLNNNIVLLVNKFYVIIVFLLILINNIK